MAARIIIKPYRIQGNNLHDVGDNDNLAWRADPEFCYVGMPDFATGKKHYGKGATPWDAVMQLARYLPQVYRNMLQARKESEIYLRPDTHNPSERVIEMNGHVPDDAEWLRQRQYFNTFGSLFYYFKQQEENSL